MPTGTPSGTPTVRKAQAGPASSAPAIPASGAPATQAGPKPTSPATHSAPVAGTPATGTAARFAQQIVDAVNAERAKAGCKPLTVNAKLQAVAQEHSDDMAARNYYEHDTPEGIDPGTRITNAGYGWQNWGENIYESPKDPATAMDGWMKSPAHRDNILDCVFTETGVGVNLSANGPWWTEDFARPR
ncbi:CAP domain-containing protein [Kitasatospora sp. NPDC086791]|uniref:CAP domain-containing protein n=1 Tax=Kitasatospora sp. NPDC086791 TaxID=3155178 RepID=UPI00342B5C5F